VKPERLEQLRQATYAWQEDVAQAQQLMLDRYRTLRRYLFAFLEAYSDAEAWHGQWALHLSSLDDTSSLQLKSLLLQGKTLIGEATAQARKMVQEQAMKPIVDVVTLDVNGAVTETDTLPLFPVVPREDREQFFTHMSRLAKWYQDMAAFIDELILSQDGDQGRET
jgi:hypothetical protein